MMGGRRTLGIRENFESSASPQLGRGESRRGGGIQSRPIAGTLSIPAPAGGRIHFAGKHTSPWNAWMNGRLESASRAATGIQAGN
jgi:monoamine oxidase